MNCCDKNNQKKVIVFEISVAAEHCSQGWGDYAGRLAAMPQRLIIPGDERVENVEPLSSADPLVAGSCSEEAFYCGCVSDRNKWLLQC
ncbi:MAG: hypothetical protein KGQ51_17595 [Planctomycetes bacterium]|nr:hypothetical protein [Planctomycetota bacterium]